jgi:hypothetical protein
MTRYTRLSHLRVAIAAALVGSLLLTSGALAQTLNPTGLVDVESPPDGSVVAGNVTFTGYAVDSFTGQPATRVAVYDGDPAQGNYLADVSMDTMRDLASIYSSGVGYAQVGWTLIFDSNRLLEGSHSLSFVAQFPNGSVSPTTQQVVIDNITQAGDSNGVMIWYNGGYWINGVFVGPTLESLYYDPINGGYWVNGVYVGPSYQWQGPYYYPTGGGYWINGTYYDPYTGQACSGGTCYYVSTGP